MTTAVKQTTQKSSASTTTTTTSSPGKREQRLEDVDDHREQLIKQRQKDAAESKARTLKMYDNMAKSGSAGDHKPLDINTYRGKESGDKSQQDETADLVAALAAAGLGGDNSLAKPAKSSPIKGRPTNPKDALLHWCYMKTRSYDEVYVENFSSSWADGLAFCALLHHFFPEEIDYKKLVSGGSRRDRFDTAFKVAEQKAKVYPLLETEDMIKMGDKPDWKCVYTYAQALYRGLKPFDPTQK